MYLNSVSMKCELLSRFDAQAKNLPRTGCTRGLEGGKRHLTALWEMRIPARNKKFFGNHVFLFGANFSTGCLWANTLQDKHIPHYVVQKIRCLPPLLTLVLQNNTPLCLTWGWGFVSTAPPFPPPPLHTQVSGLSPPLSGAQQANLSSVLHCASWRGSERGKGRRGTWWQKWKVRERRRKHWHTAGSLTCTCTKMFNRNFTKCILWAHKTPPSLFVPPSKSPPPPPRLADDKIINDILVLSLRMIRTWVNPDLMSRDLFSFFFYCWLMSACNQPGNIILS